MSVKLLTEHHLEFLSLKGGCQARLSLHLSKCQIVGNHMLQLIFVQVAHEPDRPNVILICIIML